MTQNEMRADFEKHWEIIRLVDACSKHTHFLMWQAALNTHPDVHPTLKTAAEILERFANSPADRPKIEEWEACYAKLFIQLNEALSTRPDDDAKKNGQPDERTEFGNQAEFELSLFLLNNFQIAVEPAHLKDICGVIKATKRESGEALATQKPALSEDELVDKELWKHLREFINGKTVDIISKSVTQKIYIKEARELSVAGIVRLCIEELFWMAERDKQALADAGAITVRGE